MSQSHNLLINIFVESLQLSLCMKLLDMEITKSKTPQALRQMKERKKCSPSSRMKPADAHKYPPWVFS